MHKLILIFGALLLLFSCSSSSEDIASNSPELQEVTFSFTPINRVPLTSSSVNQRISNDILTNKNSSLLTSDENNIEPFALIISIINSNNEVIISNQQLLLSSADGINFISEPVNLETGNFSITIFNVINSENEIIFAIPAEGSELSDTTNTTLPIPFTVENTVGNSPPTVATPEVISVLNTDTPELFGLASFTFDVVFRQSLFLIATESTNDIINNITSTYTLTVEGSTFSLTGTLDNGLNNLILPVFTDDTEISLTLTHDAVSQTEIITSGQINNYTQENPLVINFVNEVPLTTPPVPTFTYSSIPDYSFQTFVNTTPNTGTAQWTLPIGATVVGGSLTSEEIDVQFPNSGNFEIGLEVTSFGINENGEPVQLTGESTLEVPIVTSLNEIPDPIIIAGDFERPEELFITDEGLGRLDLGKEYWIADGVSTRVFDPRTNSIPFELFTAFPGATSNDIDWFETGSFNRVRTTSQGRFGTAASWNPGDQRVAVQYIEVIPGVDYEVSFYYSNDAASTTEALRALILDENVTTEAQLSISSNILAETITTSTSQVYVEERISFTIDSPERNAIKLYFNTTDISADFRLDDITIAID